MKKRYLYETSIHVQRAVHKITQKELGDAIGLTRQTISSIENNKPTTLINAVLIAQYFNVPVEEIFKISEV